MFRFDHKYDLIKLENTGRVHRRRAFVWRANNANVMLKLNDSFILSN